MIQAGGQGFCLGKFSGPGQGGHKGPADGGGQRRSLLLAELLPVAGDLLRLALFGGRVGKQAMGRVEPVVAVLAHAVGSEQAGEGVKVIRVSLNHLLKGVNGGRVAGFADPAGPA